MSVKIPDLPLTAGVNLDDTFEKSLHNGSGSERMTAQQLLTKIQTALASVALTGNKIALNNDGTASFANNKISMETDGTLLSLFATIGAGAEIVLNGNTGGDAHFASEKTVLAADGSAAFASGAATIGTDGSAVFNGGNFTIGNDGHIEVAGGGDASLFQGGITVTGSLRANSARVGGTLKVNTTTTGNIGAGEDDLISYTIPANTLANNGEYLEFDCWGSFAANANTKQLKVQFGTSTPVILDTTSLIFNGKSWRAHGKIVRTGDGAMTATTEFTVGGTLLSAVNGTIVNTVVLADTGVSFLNDQIVFKCTGQDSGITPVNNSIVQNGMVLKWYPAQ